MRVQVQPVFDCLRRVRKYPEANTLPKQPYPVRSAVGLVDRLAGKLQPGKRRLVLGVSIVTFSAFLLILVGSSLATRGGRESPIPATPGIAPLKQGLILPDELYLPGEPDFVPGVLLEREQRLLWTTTDAAPLWQDPLKNGEEPWRNQIEKAIDEIMERVP